MFSILVLSFISIVQNPEAKGPNPITISNALKCYLELSARQTAQLQGALKQYQQLAASKEAEIRSAQMKAAVDPSANANRLIEQDSAAIQSARLQTRQLITRLLSTRQLDRLRKLASGPSMDVEHARLSEEAADVNLIDRRTATKQPFGGTTSIFSPDTETQPNTSPPRAPKAPSKIRKPPTSPPD